MSVSLKRSAVGTTSVIRGVLVHCSWFAAAAVFVAVLSLTYGRDLSLGLF